MSGHVAASSTARTGRDDVDAGTGRGRAGESSGPHARAGSRWVVLTLLWAGAYAVLRAWYATGHAPQFAPIDTDLVGFAGWWSLVLPGAVATVVIGLRGRHGWSPGWVAAGAVAGALVVGACALTLLDLVALVLPGTGIPHNAVSVLSRLAGLAGAGLLGVVLTEHGRRWRGDCPACSRTGPRARWDDLRASPAPRWAFLMAYLAVAGMVTRVVAQAAVGFGSVPFRQNAATTLFDVGFVLAGSLLPLAMVHRWGRVWPRWVLALAGRRVPRWFVTGPGLVLSGGLTAYFGMGAVQLVVEGAPSPASGMDYPAVFFWVAVPAYLVWGLAMGAAAVSYHARTRPACRRCGR